MLLYRLSTFLILALAASISAAQDTRQVSEPKIPPDCAKLEASLRAVDGKLAESDESKLETDRIQKAIDACKPGMAVELALAKTNNAFLTGPLEMRTGITLLIDKGVTLFGSRDPKVYEMTGEGVTLGLCGTIATGAPPSTFPPPQRTPRGGCGPLISIVNATNVGIMGDGVIDGRGYARLAGKDYSWWQMARKAEPANERYYSTRLIVASHADGLVLYRITLHNSPNFHVSVNQTNGFTAWGVHIQTPTDKSLDARNTDGIDPGSSTNITVAHSWIDNGDDNIAIKTGTSHMSVLDNHFFSGHGMSIGSETFTGQSFLLVDKLTLDHTTSGIRIKSNVTRGGPVHDLVYRNICMRDVPIPIAISPYYTGQTTEPFEDPHYKGDRIPDYKRLTLENVFSETPGDVLIAGLDDQHRTEVTLNNVVIKGITRSQLHLAYADLYLHDCSAGKETNLPLTDLPASVKLIRSSEAGCAARSPAPMDSCVGRFLPMR
jgi:polygalacturonase